MRSSQSRPLAGDLAGVELVRREEAYLGTDIGALMNLEARIPWRMDAGSGLPSAQC